MLPPFCTHDIMRVLLQLYPASSNYLLWTQDRPHAADRERGNLVAAAWNDRQEVSGCNHLFAARLSHRV